MELTAQKGSGLGRSPAAGPVSTTDQDTRRLTVLVVDDEEILAERVKVEFEDAGFRAVVAYDGRKALELAEEIGPDLIVLDLLLPDIDGLECLRRIRARGHGRSPYILLLTGDSSPRAGQAAASNQRCSLLHKPCDYVFLVRLAQMLLAAQ